MLHIADCTQVDLKDDGIVLYQVFEFTFYQTQQVYSGPWRDENQLVLGWLSQRISTMSVQTLMVGLKQFNICTEIHYSSNKLLHEEEADVL